MFTISLKSQFSRWQLQRLVMSELGTSSEARGPTGGLGATPDRAVRQVWLSSAGVPRLQVGLGKK